MRTLVRWSTVALLAFLGCTQNAKNGREPAAAGMRSTSQAQRWAARQSQALTTLGVGAHYAGVDPTTAQFSPMMTAAGANLATMAAPGSAPDYFGIPNYANSALPQVYGGGAYAVATIDTASGTVTGVALATQADGGVMGGAGYTVAPTVTLVGGLGLTGTAATATALVSATGEITGFTFTPGAGYVVAPSVVITSAVVPGTGVRKFVDTLAGFCAFGTNNLGQCLPIAQPIAAGAPKLGGGFLTDADYYEIGLTQYSRKMHSDIPPTTLRGYTDLNPAALVGGAPVNQYLGPVIIAQRNRPVRVKFTNSLPVGAPGESFIPLDKSYMGAGMGPDGTNYAENRATLHLHGGNSPWISDGTPHQWTTPAGQRAFSNILKGMSTRDVPDMLPTADGQMTFYWTNEQSGRLMFYHDHSYGITRLNVYAGEAAGYLLVDPVQEQQLALATVPGTIGAPGNLADPSNDLTHVLPLVVQDKSFVPDDGGVGGQLAASDPTWDVAKWGGAGNLWYPHVMMPNQNPADMTGSSAYGRWDYGPWFWPPQNPSTFVADGHPYPCSSIAFDATTPVAFPPLMCPGTPKVSGTPEAFMDTAVVNGTAYPTTTVEPATYRFQVLNAANDRGMNMSLFYAATKDGVICKGGAVADLSTCTEVSMVPAVTHLPLCSATTTASCVCNGAFAPAGCTAPAAAPSLPLCDVATEQGASGLAVGDTSTGAILNGTGLPAGCWPTLWPNDGRTGGVPDPTTAGPAIVQLGTEGGLLPRPVVIPPMPVNYEYNRRSITVLNIFTHALLLGPAERADVVVDFSSVPVGSALILYNDSPAPVPALDPRVDYYTGGPDNSPTGGAPSTIPGYGPNTRTLMQFKVAGASTNKVAFNYASLAAAMPSIFAATQDRVIMPGTAYPAINGGAAADTYVRIQDTQVSYFNNGGVGTLTLTSGGSGYTSAPTVTIGAPTSGCVLGTPGCVQATATAQISGAVQSVALLTATAQQRFRLANALYTSPPAVTLTSASGTGAVAQANLVPTTVASVALVPANTVFTSRPTVTLSPPCVGCQPAVANVSWSAATGRATVTSVTNPAGARYTSEPIVTVSGGGASGITGVATLTGTHLQSVSLLQGGSGYTSAPTVAIATSANNIVVSAAATLGPQSVTSVALDVGGAGQGYTSAPTVTFTGGGGSGAAALAGGTTTPLQPKAIQELFTLDYGRMNATFGVEVPFTNFLTQTTIPLGYTDPPTELVKDKEPQFWKITHNGVDTHFIHFHLFTVQVINRIGWDGAIKPPDENELGWKDTVRMNPLEDIVIAIRPMAQSKLPFKLSNSVRPLDVTQPVGTALANQFTNVDPANNPVTVVNDMTNFGEEYVWHCHILGHEENDMMRAVAFVVAPDAPGTAQPAPNPNSVNVSRNGNTITVTWADNSLNETGFTVQRASLADNYATWTTLPAAGGVAASEHVTVRQNVTSYVNNNVPRGTWKYRVIANNVVGYTRQFAAPAVGYEWASGDSAPAVSPAITR